MAGGSKAHNLISLNLAVLLRNALRGSGCQTFIADMRVRIAVQSSYYYPDVVVTCAPGDQGSDAPKNHIESPSLIVEVLSPATEAANFESSGRREKMLAYRHIASLSEYVLIDQERRWVEVYRRAESGWVADLYSPGDTITLNPTTLDTGKLTFGMDDVYEGSGVV